MNLLGNYSLVVPTLPSNVDKVGMEHNIPMNKERLIIIAEWLESGASARGKVKGFNMRKFSTPSYKKTPWWLLSIKYDCGSVCCIGGSANEFFIGSGAEKNMAYYYAKDGNVAVYNAKKNLGLDEKTARMLFFCESSDSEVNPSWAARCIRRLIRTGKVDWNATQYVKA